MKSTWDIDKGYQPPFDRLCQKVEEQEKTIKELNERINTLEFVSGNHSDSMVTAVKTELMLSSSIDRIKQDIQYLKKTQGVPLKAYDWLLIFVVLSVIFCWVIIPAFGLWLK
jgi:hypothetical protein